MPTGSPAKICFPTRFDVRYECLTTGPVLPCAAPILVFRVRPACSNSVALAFHRVVEKVVVLHQEKHVIDGDKIPLTAQYFLKQFQTRWPATVVVAGNGVRHVVTKVGLLCGVLIYLSEHDDYSTSK